MGRHDQHHALPHALTAGSASIVITTSRPAGAWGEILGDTTVAAAMLDRLLHRSVVGHSRRGLLPAPQPRRRIERAAPRDNGHKLPLI